MESGPSHAFNDNTSQNVHFCRNLKSQKTKLESLKFSITKTLSIYCIGMDDVVIFISIALNVNCVDLISRDMKLASKKILLANWLNVKYSRWLCTFTRIILN